MVNDLGVFDRYTKEAISDSSKLLEINPEILTIWNYRKLAFQQNLKEATDSEHIKSLVDDELRAVRFYSFFFLGSDLRIF